MKWGGRKGNRSRSGRWRGVSKRKEEGRKKGRGIMAREWEPLCLPSQFIATYHCSLRSHCAARNNCAPQSQFTPRNHCSPRNHCTQRSHCSSKKQLCPTEPLCPTKPLCQFISKNHCARETTLSNWARRMADFEPFLLYQGFYSSAKRYTYKTLGLLAGTLLV